MKKILLYISILMSCNAHHDFKLQPGDLLFQDLDCGPLCEAIEAVTFGLNGADFSHIGLVDVVDNEINIIEANSNGVVYTSLEEFLNRSHDEDGNPKVIVGRLKKEYKYLIQPALEFARLKMGMPYNVNYIMNDSAYYCSQLVYQAFFDSKTGEFIFQLAPMTFKEPQNKKFFPAWVDYYKKLEKEIPESLPGINPAGISRSNAIEIVHIYGKPQGWQ